MPDSVLQKIEIASGEPAPAKTTADAAPFIEVENLNLHYGPVQALKNISLTMKECVVTAFIGPSGCGKSTLIRCLNRMNDLIDGVRIAGAMRIGGHDIYARDVDVIELRNIADVAHLVVDCASRRRNLHRWPAWP